MYDCIIRKMKPSLSDPEALIQMQISALVDYIGVHAPSWIVIVFSEYDPTYALEWCRGFLREKYGEGNWDHFIQLEID